MAGRTLYERLGLTTNPFKGAVRMESDQVAWIKLFELQSCLSWQFGDGPKDRQLETSAKSPCPRQVGSEGDRGEP
jgi:hypothetical protein